MIFYLLKINAITFEIVRFSAKIIKSATAGSPCGTTENIVSDFFL